MNTADNCTDPTENKDSNGKVPALPSWRMNELVLIAFKTILEADFLSPDFDYKKMILNSGIRLKPYSAFDKKNLEEMQKLSLSYWNEGLCIVFPDEVNGGQCKLIAYNDSKPESQIMQIIFHEYAHITLKHTQQCIHGELEATYFAAAMSIILILEKKLHFGKLFGAKENRAVFLRNINRQMASAAKEAV